MKLTIKHFVLMGCVLALGACGTNCYEQVAIAKISVDEAYKSTADASEAESISVGAAEEALRILDSADAAVNKASGLCGIDERSAQDYLDAVTDGLNEISEITKKESVDE